MNSIYEHLPVAVYTCDKEGYITSFNQAAAKLWGRDPQIGKERWGGAFKTYKLNGDVLPLDECPTAIALKTGKAVQGAEILMERPNGQVLNVRPYPTPVFDEKGILMGAVNTLVDITEDKTRETRDAMLAANFGLDALAK